MHVTATLALLLLPLVFLSDAVAGQAALPLQLQADAVSAAYSTRVTEFGDSACVESCALSRLLGSPTLYLPLLSEPLRSHVAPVDPTTCSPRSGEIHPGGSWWYVDGVERSSDGAVDVHARLLVPHSRSREETYRLRTGADGQLRVTDIRLRPSTEKVTQPLVPPRAPPVTRHNRADAALKGRSGNAQTETYRFDGRRTAAGMLSQVVPRVGSHRLPVH